MKHAGDAALDRLAPLLCAIRSIAPLKERSRGVFYLRSKAFLHFHEDSAGLFVDVRPRADGDFIRMQVDAADAREHLLQIVRQAVAGDR